MPDSEPRDGAPAKLSEGTLAEGSPSDGAPAERNLQAEADRAIKGLQAGLDADAAVYAMAVLVNRAAAELHRLAKSEATARKGTEQWGTWAALQNSARRLVLDSSPARDGAARLAGRAR